MRNLIGGSPTIAAKAMRGHFTDYGGMLIGPRSGNDPRHAIRMGAVWAMDNDCFNHFNPDAILKMYRRHQGKPSCIFAVAPDVVSDAKQTLIRFAWWQPIIKHYGYPVALAIQNGQEHYRVPWDQLDAIFIAGDTEFKLGAFAAGVAREAKRRGKWVHMGRVNSNKRARYAASIGCDSFDGTGYSIAMNKHVPEVLPYQINKQMSLWSL